jgi:hypothetical protein
MSRLQEKKEFEAVAVLERAALCVLPDAHILRMIVKLWQMLVKVCFLFYSLSSDHLSLIMTYSDSAWSDARAVASYVLDFEHVL